MRRLKNKATASTLMDGQRINYDFIGPHMSLDGKTPAEKAKLSQNLERDKWVSLIKKSEKGMLVLGYA